MSIESIKVGMRCLLGLQHDGIDPDQLRTGIDALCELANMVADHEQTLTSNAEGEGELAERIEKLERGDARQIEWNHGEEDADDKIDERVTALEARLEEHQAVIENQVATMQELSGQSRIRAQILAHRSKRIEDRLDTEEKHTHECHVEGAEEDHPEHPTDFTHGAPDDPLITVCANCLRASCWQGICYCDGYKTACTIEKRRSELQRLGYESSHYWITPGFWPVVHMSDGPEDTDRALCDEPEDTETPDAEQPKTCPVCGYHYIVHGEGE